MFSSRGVAIALLALLTTQAALLAYSATRHSATNLEPAFFVSGISHWKFGRYELYRVNPPLVRMIAAIPVLAVGCKTDWSKFYDGPGARAEFRVGEDFVKANGIATTSLLTYARWACIPFSLAGAFFVYQWARELYCEAAGLLAMTLYVFEPNLLAHGELITPDGACTAFGVIAGYSFWRWLKQPSWPRAVWAGGALGLAELTKQSWIILFGLWPILWLAWRIWGSRASTSGLHETENYCGESDVAANERLRSNPQTPSFPQFAVLLLVSLAALNLGYGCDGFATPLREFEFVSMALNGSPQPGATGNRFRESCLAGLPILLPKQYVLGFDSQKKDFEVSDEKSYLRGEWKSGGWWYYYIYGLLVKVPCGTWGLFALAVAVRLTDHQKSERTLDEIILLAPALALMILVSSQTAFNIHLRYVFPCLGFEMVFLGQVAFRFGHRFKLVSILAFGFLGYSIASSVYWYPNHLSYFNDFVGGPLNGHQHLLGSSFDWGQNSLWADSWLKEQQSTFNRRCVYLPAGTLSADSYLANARPPGSVESPDVVLIPKSLLLGDSQASYDLDGKVRRGLIAPRDCQSNITSHPTGVVTLVELSLPPSNSTKRLSDYFCGMQ